MGVLANQLKGKKAMENTNTDQAKKSYFNIYSSMNGYINKIYWKEGNERKEDGSNKNPLTVKFVALYGDSNAPKRKYFFLDIYDNSLKEDFLALSQQYDLKEDKLFASIKVSEGDVLPYVIDSGESAGQIRLNYFGALIDFNSLSVNGTQVYKAVYTDTSTAVGAS